MNRRDLFEELLRTAGEQSSSFPEDSLTAFWPMRGHNWNGELMVVGRAVNGWTDPWLPTTAVDPVRRSDILAMTLRASEGKGRDCPMLWVSKGWGGARHVQYETVGVLARHSANRWRAWHLRP
jgi:hypothetical protein